MAKELYSSGHGSSATAHGQNFGGCIYDPCLHLCPFLSLQHPGSHPFPTRISLTRPCIIPLFPRHRVVSVPPKGNAWLMRVWTLWLMTSRQWAHILTVLGKMGRAPMGLQPFRDIWCWDTLSLPLFLTLAPAFHRLVVPIVPQMRFSLFRGFPMSHGSFLLCDPSSCVVPPFAHLPSLWGSRSQALSLALALLMLAALSYYVSFLGHLKVT